MTKKNLYEYIDDHGSFRVLNPPAAEGLYFPLVNEAGLLSAITPGLKGDIKVDQHTFLTLPVTREDLHLSRASRNFWLSLGQEKAWSINGQSVWQRSEAYGKETVQIEAGLLWHEMTRTNKKLGLQAKVLNFAPAGADTLEVMQVQIRNISSQPLRFTATSAIPLYGRSADNLRDHRHVTSLLNRVSIEKFGISLKPTMSFNEKGHSVNHTQYFVVGCSGHGQAPTGIYPTVQSFVGIGGDLERPGALSNGSKPVKTVSQTDQGKESMGALRFKEQVLRKGQTATFILLLGIDQAPKKDHSSLIKLYGTPEKIKAILKQTKSQWENRADQLSMKTGDDEFNSWLRWVRVQPTFRKIYGCSFLPDFDYGRGGRGWRDLWQDCLALLLADPRDVREIIRNNFKGVRMDGSNATIISRQRVGAAWEVEFLADRNNIVRTWMDHGVWPYLTTQLYCDQTGDWEFLLEKIPFFRDAQRRRGRVKDESWDSTQLTVLNTAAGHIYKGTVLEHILVQTLVPFFNVGSHNNIRLEDADWNDGLDMARDKGESVAFTAMYAGNMESLATALEWFEKQSGQTEIEVAVELLHLMDSLGSTVDYDRPEDKIRVMNKYFDAVSESVTGAQVMVSLNRVRKDLRQKASWTRAHLNKNEWITHQGQSWFNGYYDNQGRRVEGPSAIGKIQMTLTGQVFQIMAHMAPDERIPAIVQSVNTHLWDKNLGSVRLNSDFGQIQPDLGRAFSFSYGDKENGAVFSHMVVMYANALYKRGFVDEGHRTLQSLYLMAKNSQKSRIYPGLPEYFNNEGRGLYHFLTGSASWYILTMVADVFGVKGDGGNLKLAPKLVPAQFDKKQEAAITVPFAGSTIKVTYHNKKKVPYAKYKIVSVVGLPYTSVSPKEIVIQRERIEKKKKWEIHVELA